MVEKIFAKRGAATKGFTLIEMAVATGTWLIVSAGVLFVLNYTMRQAEGMLRQQAALENARSAMDVLVANIQLSSQITLTTDGDHVLRQLDLVDQNPLGLPHVYTFLFDIHAPADSPRYQVLQFGDNEFAAGLAAIIMAYHPGHAIAITIYAAEAGEPSTAPGLRLHALVDARYKTITHIWV